ncbi:MAG TPA: DUF1573 domain-containing protein [Puia sp.]|jgi:hypothetical protein
MKKLFLFASALALSTTMFAQTTASQKKADDVVKFKDLAYDFGKIKQNVPVSHDFVFVNVSDAPVIIESATPSCGCTTPTKPEGAIPKGKESKITAAYNAAAVGSFNKTVTVKIAGIDMPVVLKITGQVLPPDANAKSEAPKGGQ